MSPKVSKREYVHDDGPKKELQWLNQKEKLIKERDRIANDRDEILAKLEDAM